MALAAERGQAADARAGRLRPADHPQGRGPRESGGGAPASGASSTAARPAWRSSACTWPRRSRTRWSTSSSARRSGSPSVRGRWTASCSGPMHSERQRDRDRGAAGRRQAGRRGAARRRAPRGRAVRGRLVPRADHRARAGPGLARWRARRSSARRCRSGGSPAWTRRSSGPTTRRSASARRCGRTTSTPPPGRPSAPVPAIPGSTRRSEGLRRAAVRRLGGERLRQGARHRGARLLHEPSRGGAAQPAMNSGRTPVVDRNLEAGRGAKVGRPLRRRRAHLRAAARPDLPGRQRAARAGRGPRGPRADDPRRHVRVPHGVPGRDADGRGARAGVVPGQRWTTSATTSATPTRACWWPRTRCWSASASTGVQTRRRLPARRHPRGS